jgi:hypothetical protein
VEIPPSLFTLSLLCLNLSSHVFSALGLSPLYCFPLTDNSGSRVPLNGRNQLASRVPEKEMVKGKRPKDGNKESPKESLSAQQSAEGNGGVQVLPPKKKKEKPSSAHGALPATPSHPPPVKNAPPSGGTSLTLLQRSPPREETKKERKGKEKDETSSQSSQEAELDASIMDKKGKKKKGQAMLAASPTKDNSEDEKEDTLGSENSLPALESSEERSPAGSTDFLAEFLGDEKDGDLSPVPDDYSAFLKKTGD